MEGSEALVARGERECRSTTASTNARFEARDLYAPDFDASSLPAADRVLLDPPRSGAERICAQMDRIGAASAWSTCPAIRRRSRAMPRCWTEAATVMTAAGIVDMFPHTAHVESMAFVRARRG